MNEPVHDGRIVLCKNTLKSLRRKVGASQEQMAFQCAERGLCVSVASLKRAETSKNVLYRTARDIAQFFSVDINDLVETNSDTTSSIKLTSPNTPQSLSDQQSISSTSNITITRHFILCDVELISDTLALSDSAKIAGALESYCLRYHAINITNNIETSSPAPTSVTSTESNKRYFSFGSHSTKGNETERALQFSFAVIEQIKVLGYEVKIALNWCKTDAVIHESNIPSSQIIISPLQLQNTSNILEHAPGNTICVDDSFKNSIREPLNYKLVTNNNTQHIWQVLSKPTRNLEENTKPFVGRKIERIQFQAVLESALEYKSTQLVYLVGPAGIGKSRLVDEFKHTIDKDDFETHTIHIFNYNVGQKQQAIPQLIRSLLSITDDVTPLSAENLQEICELKWLNQTKYLPILYSLLSWQIPKKWMGLLEAMSSERLLQAQSDLLCLIIKERLKYKTLILTIEDYHWADKHIHHYLNHLIAKLTTDPIVFLFTSRPSDHLTSLISENEAVGNANTIINLSPLSQKDASIFAESYADIKTEYREKCIEKAQGNPLFLEQLLKDKNASYDSKLPFSLQSLIAARIDSMNQNDQLAVRAAAVIGSHFSLDLLRKLIQDPTYNIEPLIRSNIIHRKENDYAFNHALIFDGIYQSLSEDNRNTFHYICSEWFHQDLALQCHHLLKANHDSAINKIIPAIKHLIHTFKFEQAKELINIGLKKFNPSSILSTLYGLNAEVDFRLGETQLALDSYNQQLQHSTSANERANTLIEIANCFNTLDQHENALSSLNKAHKISLEQQYISLLSRIYYLHGNLLFPKGQVEECFEYHKKALHYARQAHNTEMEARALGGLGDAAYAKGKMFSAHRYFSHCLELCDKHDLKQVSAANLFMLGTVTIYHNKTQDALSVTEQSIQTAELVGHKRAEIVSRLTASWILLDWLRLDEALEHINTGLEIAKEIGAKRFIPFLLESKARYYFLYSDKNMALKSINTAIDDVDELKAHAFIGPWLLGTRATFSESWKEAERDLKMGTTILNKGSIGHNHYRFYIAAIDACLKHKQYKEASHYLHHLKAFTHDEETPWSNFYIDRAEYIIDNENNPNNTDNKKLTQLISQAENAKLLSALPLLEKQLCDTLAL